MKISEVRSHFPEYDDLSDEDLTDALHRTHFSDMPREEFEADFHAPTFDYSGGEPFSHNRLKFEMGLVKNKDTSKKAVMIPASAGLSPAEVVQLAKASGMKPIKENGAYYLYDPKQVKEAEIKKAIKTGKEGHLLGYGTDTVPHVGTDYAVDLDGHGTVNPHHIAELLQNDRIGFAGKALDLDTAIAKIKEMGRQDAVITGLEENAPPQIETGDSVPTEPGQSIEARANGGPVVAGKPYLVGERGPEIIIPSANGAVMPNESSMAYLMNMNRKERDATHFPQGGDTRTFQQHDRSNAIAKAQLQPAYNALSDPVNATIGGDVGAQQRVLQKVAQVATDPMMVTFAGPKAKGFAKAEGKFTDLGDKVARFEIDDSGAVIKDLILPQERIHGHVVESFKLGDVLDHPELFENYPELKDLSMSFTKSGNLGEYSPIGHISMSESAYRKPAYTAEEAARMESASKDFNDFYKRTDVMAHEKALEKITDNAEFERIYNETGGPAFTRESDRLWQLTKPQTPPQGYRLAPGAKGTLLHEIQHAVQEREGMAKGGSASEMAREFNNARARLNFLEQEPGYQQANKAVDELWDGVFSGKIPETKAAEIEQSLHRTYPILKEVRALTDSLRKYGGEPTKGYSPGQLADELGHTAYQRLAGEEEARRTAARAGLTAQERIGNPYGMTDVKGPRDLIYRTR